MDVYLELIRWMMRAVVVLLLLVVILYLWRLLIGGAL